MENHAVPLNIRRDSEIFFLEKMAEHMRRVGTQSASLDEVLALKDSLDQQPNIGFDGVIRALESTLGNPIPSAGLPPFEEYRRADDRDSQVFFLERMSEHMRRVGIASVSLDDVLALQNSLKQQPNLGFGGVSIALESTLRSSVSAKTEPDRPLTQDIPPSGHQPS